MQIGSHNGQTGDPLQAHIDSSPGWRGLMVEPTPEHFASLTECRGGDPRFRLVRAAVTDHEGTVEMTTVEVSDDLPWWADQLSTVSVGQREALEASPEFAGRLRTIEVPAITFDSLTAGVERIDLLQIDTEGHDSEILDQVDLRRWRPDVVVFEALSLTSEDLARCRSRLMAAGYVLLADHQDIIAVRRWTSMWPRPRR